MKRTYGGLRLVEYGRLDEITLGTGGTLPDFVGTNIVNNSCGTQTFTGSTNGTTSVFSRTSCSSS